MGAALPTLLAMLGRNDCCRRGKHSWTPVAKAFEKIVIGPCTLMRTWGTRPRHQETNIRLGTEELAHTLVFNLKVNKGERCV